MPVPSHAPAIDRRLLRDDVYHRLRDVIVDGSLAPGEQLRDVELAAWLGVSRTPVREALLRLAEAGLVVARPGRSTTVSSLDLRAVRDARDVVAAMHELAVREAVGSLTRADLEAMREANHRFGAAIEQGDVEAALRADDDLHAVPVSVTSNRALTAVLEQFTPVLRRAERLRFSSLAGRASLDRHDELIRLCAAGDADRAAAVAFDTWRTLPTTEE
ncbi:MULTISPECIES: GntR family transcriptional regulator [unclassified Plantactinospora]|uniref:GntR family transcriptional regulator n=1 Tax=unclassified Plantactinospora TaxID=2631981 RepID=UPI000D165F01|nr:MULTISPECIES: GntR family transcriptional regulator [unclassified Plantactinospora]AVT29401.1 GntR family transcriptional regulator [Plantactinospora sp. BC1]AVT35813.1 GntR family transcriptional regulator [Plantactinospora sp. BB1]